MATVSDISNTQKYVVDQRLPLVKRCNQCRGMVDLVSSIERATELGIGHKPPPGRKDGKLVEVQGDARNPAEYVGKYIHRHAKGEKCVEPAAPNDPTLG